MGVMGVSETLLGRVPCPPRPPWHRRGSIGPDDCTVIGALCATLQDVGTSSLMVMALPSGRYYAQGIVLCATLFQSLAALRSHPSLMLPLMSLSSLLLIQKVLEPNYFQRGHIYS